MRIMPLVCVAAGALTLCATAGTISTGTPNYEGSGLAPRFGTLINFDNLTPASPLSSNAYAAEGVSSITDGSDASQLYAIPFSSMSQPNYVSTYNAIIGGSNSTGDGDITISFAAPQGMVGIGIIGDGTTTYTLSVENASGGTLDSFNETINPTTQGFYNAYFVISEPTSDISSFSISAPQDLGVDDVQFAMPEPSCLPLAGVGLGIIAAIRMRFRRA